MKKRVLRHRRFLLGCLLILASACTSSKPLPRATGPTPIPSTASPTFSPDVMVSLAVEYVSGFGAPRGVAIDASSQRAYIASATSNSVAVLDIKRKKILAKIPVPGAPNCVGLDSSIARAYVTSSGRLVTINMRLNKVERVINLGSELACVAVKESSHAVYVTDTNAHKVWRVDGERGTISSSISLSDEPEGITANTRTGFIYVSSAASGKLFVIDSTDRLIRTIDVAPGAARVACDPESGIIYAASNEQDTVFSVDLRKSPPTSKFSEVRSPLALAIDEMYGVLYVASVDLEGATGAGRLVALSLSSGKIVGEAEIAGAPWYIAVDPNAHSVIVGNIESGSVAIVSVSR